MRLTTILLVSRVEYLDRVLDSLKNQKHYKPAGRWSTSAFVVIFDGSDEDFTVVKQKIADFDYPYDVVHCLKSTNTRPAFAIAERRQHIANMHNQAREYVEKESVYGSHVFLIEDDGILPPDAYATLSASYKHETTGIVTGVELGRWGVPYVGAWRVDDVDNPTKVRSMENKTGQHLIEAIDGCGLYCAIVRADLYKSHEFGVANGLGPDVNLGLYCRQQGYNNYIVWSVPVTHLTNRNGIEMEIPATDISHIVELSLLNNKVWQQIKYPLGVNIPTLKEKYGQVMF